MGKTKLISQYCLTLTAEGVHIDGHRGISEYSSDLISVRTKTKLITLKGDNLNLGAMDKSEVLITGNVTDIRISEMGRGRN